MAQNYGALKVIAPSIGALVVTLTLPSGATPSAFSDAAVTVPVTLPITVAPGATQWVYFPQNISATLSVTFSGAQVADPAQRAVQTVDISSGEVCVRDYSQLNTPSAIAAITNLIRPNLLTAVGDSITNNSGLLDPTNPSNAQLWSTKGYAPIANALAGGRFAWVSPGATGPGSVADNGATPPNASGAAGGVAFARGGIQTTDILTYGYAAAAAASAASVVVVHIGTNDINAGSDGPTAAANILAIWRVLTAAGKKVIGTTILPRDSTVITGTKLTALNAANQLIRKNAAAEPNVFLCDWHAALLDTSAAAPSGGAASAWFLDGLHPNTVGAWRMGASLASVLNGLAPAGLPADHLPINPADALTPNPFAIGGASTATSWTLTNVGTPTSVTPTKVGRTDLVGGAWQQVASVAATADSDGYTLTLTDSTTTDWAVGDVVYAACEIQADSAGWDCRGLQLDVVLTGQTPVASANNISSAERTALTVPLGPAPTGGLILVTPRITIPASITAVRAVLRFYGSGTIRVARMGVRKV